MILLGDHTAGRANNTPLLRLLAASAVLVFHAYALTQHWVEEPLYRLTGDNLGAVGVKCFFVLSGFLVTQSWLARPRLATFAAARVLRIYPALVVAVIVSVLLAGMSSAVPWGSFLADERTLRYVADNALAWRAQFTLPGAFATNPFPDAVNGSLWTLPVEVRLYIGVAIAGLCGVLARRAVLAACLAVLTAFAVALPGALPLGSEEPVVAELALLFALGSLAYAWRDRIPLSIPAVALVLAAYLWNPGGALHGAWAAPLFAYAVLTLAYHPTLQVPRLNPGGDYSYGVYLYAFPIQQSLLARAPTLDPLTLLLCAFPLALGAAAVSWHALEKPALALKRRVRTVAAGAS